jgi:hypothetical protein
LNWGGFRKQCRRNCLGIFASPVGLVCLLGWRVSKLRLSILVFGPLLIVAASISLCERLRSDSTGPAGANHVLVSQVMADDTPQTAPEEKLVQACEQVADKLRPRLGDKCHLIVRPPMVIAGDMDEDDLETWHKETIGPAAAAMANRYFERAPDEPITVLLFEKESSYNHYAEKLYGDRNVSIYGYYKPRERVLVMNIGTGGGTLVHELTHALADFDFPKIPDWFNEGLASLHEQCRFRDDDDGPWIEGLENWRLPGLQKAIRGKRVGTLKSLVEGRDFRGAHEGLNYAQARYFCLYMQRHDVLEDFYRRFREHQADDPRGAASVLAMFPTLTWDDLDKDFREWALELGR